MRSTTKYLMIAVMTALTLSGLSSSARADDQVTPPVASPGPGAVAEPTPATEPDKHILVEAENSDKWVFTSPLFLWLAGVKGDVAGPNGKADIDLTPGDIREHTEIGFTGWFDLTKGRLGFYVNPTFLRLEADGKFAAGKVTDTLDQWIVEFAAHYKFWEWKGDHPGSLKAIVGGRYFSLHNDLTFNPIIGPNVNAVESFDLTDPIFGLRYEQYYTEKLHVWVQGDVGGFDISENQSRFAWQIMPIVGYDFTMIVIKKPSTVFAGFRMMGIEYEHGGGATTQSFNLKYYGAVLGLNVILF